MKVRPRILLINADGRGASRLAQLLDRDECEIHALADRSDIPRSIEDVAPDMIALECDDPVAEAVPVCAGVRRRSLIPLVVCSTSSLEADIVRVFEAGADDYLLLPMRPVELRARVRAVLRRAGEAPKSGATPDRLVSGDIEVRLDERKVFRAGTPVDLSPIEFRLLSLLVREAGGAVSHSRLIAHAWGPEYVECRHYLRLYIKYLRSKLEENPREPRRILSEWGVGYRFEPSGAVEP
jgi:two-component system KDP operon response regulator KdpE